MTSKDELRAGTVLIDMLAMVESDLMKAHHYLEKAIRISLTAQPDPNLKVHQDIAQISVIVAKEIKALNHIQRQLATLNKEPNKGEDV